MAYNATLRNKSRRRSRPTTQVNTLPAPIGGIDAKYATSQGNPNVCVYTRNLIPSELGMKVRKGYREWQIDVDGDGVNTLIPFENGDTGGSIEDRLFAVTHLGIYDVTDAAATPILMTAPIDWTDTSTQAGWGTFTSVRSDAGDQFIYYADSKNGLFVYTASTDSWARPVGLVDIVVENINSVVAHKLRIWFGVENESHGYYLGINAITGTAKRFNFGIQFKHGGQLAGLFNWTVDGGVGVDDYLVAVSTSGDVLPYTGVDPEAFASGSWGMQGVYYVGDMVKGSRVATQQGGNLLLLSVYGITAMSDLLRGVDPRLPNTDSFTSRIAPFIKEEMPQYRNELGWDVTYLPNDGAVVVNTPKRLDGTYVQYVYNLAVGGWGLWKELPVRCITSWKGTTYFGTEDKRVCSMDVSKDNVLIDAGDPLAGGVNIQFDILFNYSNMGTPAGFKRGVMVRPDFLTSGNVVFETKILYDYDITSINTTASDASGGSEGWDVSKWDVAVWAVGGLTGVNAVQGSTGIGRTLATAIKGNCLGDTYLLSTDIFWNVGGAL